MTQLITAESHKYSFMVRPRHTRRLNIKEKTWYSATELVEAGWEVYCCIDVLIRYLRSYMGTTRHGITERRKPGTESGWNFDMEDWQYSFKSRGMAKAIFEDMKLRAAEEALDHADATPGQFLFNCPCEEAAYAIEQKRKYGAR